MKLNSKITKKLVYQKIRYTFFILFLVTGLYLISACTVSSTPNTPSTQTTESSKTIESTIEVVIENKEETSIDSTIPTTTISESITEQYEMPSHSTIEYYPYNDYRNKYPDFMGWLTIPGTNIDEPIVQTNDNEHYLNYDYTNSKNYAGAIYMDYKNKGNFYDNHITLYGHYMKNGTMFHDLHLFKDKTFFEENHSIYLTGFREQYRYEIYSVQIVSADHYYLFLNLDAGELNEYALHFQRESLFTHEIPQSDNLKLLTLVTCTYEFDNARLLIHAYQVEPVPFIKP